MPRNEDRNEVRKKPEYIEREALIEELEEELAFDTPMYTDEENKFINRGLKIAIKDVNSIPTADVSEVKHGRNITKIHPADEFICSECGFMCKDLTEKVYNENGDYFYHQAYECNYCPNCGVKMDKE